MVNAYAFVIAINILTSNKVRYCFIGVSQNTMIDYTRLVKILQVCEVIVPIIVQMG